MHTRTVKVTVSFIYLDRNTSERAVDVELGSNLLITKLKLVIIKFFSSPAFAVAAPVRYTLSVLLSNIYEERYIVYLVENIVLRYYIICI